MPLRWLLGAGLATLVCTACDDGSSLAPDVRVDAAQDQGMALDAQALDLAVDSDGPQPDTAVDGGLPDVAPTDGPHPWQPCVERPSPRDGLVVRGCSFGRSDQTGTTVPRGVVVSGDSLTRASRTPFHEPSHYAQLAEAYDLVWLLVTWDGIEPRPGTYNGAYLGRVCEQAGWAADAGLDVVLAMYFEDFGYGVGGVGAPGWLMADWDRLWADPALVDGLQNAWSRLIDTCAGARIAGVQVIAGVEGGGEAYPALVEAVRALAEAAFGSQLLFYDPAGGDVPSGPDVVVAPSGRRPAPSDRAVADQARAPVFFARPRLEDLDQVAQAGAAWAVWHDGFGGADALRDEEGLPTDLAEAVAGRPRVTQLSGRLIAYGGEPWTLRWYSDRSNAGVSRVDTRGRVPGEVDLVGAAEWLHDYDPATDTLTVFVDGPDGEVSLTVAWAE